jgi:hypothetical protein
MELVHHVRAAAKPHFLRHDEKAKVRTDFAKYRTEAKARTKNRSFAILRMTR